MGPRPGRATPVPRIAALVLATALAAIGALAPSAAGRAAAAGTLRIEAAATYDLDPGAGRVRVAVDFDLTNLKAPTGTTFFFYTSAFFAIQPEATNIRVSDAAGPLSITTTERRSFTRVDITLRARLLYQQTARLTLRYDLIGGAPRSRSAVRVNRAFATFGVWAWGDAGRSRVAVHIPEGYDVEFDGDDLPRDTRRPAQTFVAKPDRPTTFFAIVSADNSEAYATARVSVDGGIELVVRSWPDDDRWARAVTGTLRDGMPELVELIGLDWPVTHELLVRERYTPSLEGYAGFFLGADEGIEVTEDLDGTTILHEASHAWFNEALFLERWVYEGLAQEYSWRTQRRLGEDPGFEPTKPDPDDPGRIALADWGYPRAIRDQETDDLERYGYDTSFWVVHLMAEDAGPDRMRDAFDAAAAHRIAYVGAPEPEKVPGHNDWHRFLDLTQPIDAPGSPDVEAALRDLVVAPGDASLLDRRDAAREAYRGLVAAGNGWLPPYVVRRAMSSWTFDVATTAMADATAVLARRDEVAAAGAALGLTSDDSLRTAYENASSDFAEASRIADEQLAALTALSGARTAVDAPLDLIAQVGLLGASGPADAYATARTAFERGELDVALASAGSVTALVAGASVVGQQRLLLAAGVVVGLFVLLGVLVIVRRRRGPRAPIATLAPEWPASDLLAPRPDTPPAPAWWLPTRSSPDAGSSDTGTLAADPALGPPPPGRPPDLEGEQTQGESPHG